MNKTLLYVLLGAAVGYVRSRTKKGRTMAAVKGAALGWGLTAIAPKIGLNLPAPSGLVRTS